MDDAIVMEVMITEFSRYIFLNALETLFVKIVTFRSMTGTGAQLHPHLERIAVSHVQVINSSVVLYFSWISGN